MGTRTHTGIPTIRAVRQIPVLHNPTSVYISRTGCCWSIIASSSSGSLHEVTPEVR